MIKGREILHELLPSTQQKHIQQLQGQLFELALYQQMVQSRIALIGFRQALPEILDGFVAICRFEVLADNF